MSSLVFVAVIVVVVVVAPSMLVDLKAPLELPLPGLLQPASFDSTQRTERYVYALVE